MAVIQSLLVYVIVALAVGYILKKFFLPKTLFASKKSSNKSCGSDSCGCH